MMMTTTSEDIEMELYKQILPFVSLIPLRILFDVC